jgi:peptide deformylase
MSVTTDATTAAVMRGLMDKAYEEDGLKLVASDAEVLRAVAEPVPEGADVKLLVARMLECMLRGGGIGLAAPQVGVGLRVIIGVCQARGESWSFALINPVIVRRGKDLDYGREGCLSLPGKFVPHRRHKLVTVEGFDVDWKPVHINARGLLARVLQHEIDHLDGVLMTDGQLSPQPGPQKEFMERKVVVPGAPAIVTREKHQVEVVAPGIGLVRKAPAEDKK